MAYRLFFISANCNVPTGDFDQLVYDYHDVMLRTLGQTESSVHSCKQQQFEHAYATAHVRHEPSGALCTGPRVAPMAVDQVQVKTGIIAPNGEWIAWCDPSGEDSVTLELEF